MDSGCSSLNIETYSLLACNQRIGVPIDSNHRITAAAASHTKTSMADFAEPFTCCMQQTPWDTFNLPKYT